MITELIVLGAVACIVLSWIGWLPADFPTQMAISAGMFFFVVIGLGALVRTLLQLVLAAVTNLL